ncbi:hypothetical protein QTP88_004658 [Uroleucon formosanum]
MLYRIAKWKMQSQNNNQSFKQGLVSLCRRRTFTKRPPAKVDIPIVSGHNPTGVSASAEYATLSKLLFVSIENTSKIRQRMKILETAEDLELCTSLQSNSFRPMTEIIDLEHNSITEDCDSKIIKPPHKAYIEKENSIYLIVAMFKGLSLDDKRKIKESDKEHFETFHSHRPYAQPYGKRIKVSNN